MTDVKPNMELEYHKGEFCPYAEKMSRRPVLCQEGFCCRCQVWIDFKQAQDEADRLPLLYPKKVKKFRYGLRRS